MKLNEAELKHLWEDEDSKKTRKLLNSNLQHLLNVYAQYYEDEDMIKVASFSSFLQLYVIEIMSFTLLAISEEHIKPILDILANQIIDRVNQHKTHMNEDK